jgi:hypothetical protein
LRIFKRFGATGRAGGHQSHAAVGLLEISQAVADFDADEWEFFVTEIFRNADVAVPATPETKARREFPAVCR